VKTTPYEPSSNPVVRFHRTVHSLLAKINCIQTSGRLGLVLGLYFVLLQHECASQHWIHTALFNAWIEARWNIDVLLDNMARKSDVNAYAAELLDRLDEAYRITRDSLGQTAAYEKSWYDRSLTTTLSSSTPLICGSFRRRLSLRRSPPTRTTTSSFGVVRG